MQLEKATFTVTFEAFGYSPSSADRYIPCDSHMINPHCHMTLADLKLPIPRWLSSYVVQVGQWLRSNFIWSHDCHVTSSHPQSRGTWRRRPCWCSQHCVWCTRGMPCLKGECCLDNCHFCSCRATFNPLLSCDQKTIPSLLFFTPLSPLLTSLPPSLPPSVRGYLTPSVALGETDIIKNLEDTGKFKIELVESS